jgi:hypothetical protein
MKCTSCNKTVAEDAAVCPYCDAVLDPSLLDAAPPDDDGDEPRPPPRKPVGKPLTRPGVKKVLKKKPVAGARPKPKPRVEDDDEPPPTAKKPDWRDSVSAEDWKEGAGREKEAFVVDRALNPDDAMLKTRQYLWSLPLADKLALAGSSVLLISTFLPWKETVKDGDVLGVFSSGVIVTLLAAMAVAGLLVRTLKSMPTLNPLLPWAAQLGCVGISGVWCLVYIMLSVDSTLVQSSIGNQQIWASKPSLGVFIAVVAGVISILGTIFGLKDVGR